MRALEQEELEINACLPNAPASVWVNLVQGGAVSLQYPPFHRKRDLGKYAALLCSSFCSNARIMW